MRYYLDTNIIIYRKSAKMQIYPTTFDMKMQIYPTRL